VPGWGRDKFISTAKLRNPDFGFCVNDSVIFKVEIAIFGDLHEADSRNSTFENFPRRIRLPSLTECMKDLLLSGDLADVTILVGKERLGAHRLILSARSPVFKAMLLLDMSEKTTGVIVIEDVELEVMRECLSFMYTDAFSNDTVILYPILPPL
jgi:BTB/POZ domain